MRVLVTGSAGAVGRPVVAALREEGHDVRTFDRHGDADVTGDLADVDVVDEAVEGCEVVVHLAACPDVAPFAADLVPANVVGFHNVLTACRLHRVRRLIFASTARVASGWKGDGPKPATAALPNDDYALTKLFAENAAEMFCRRHGLNALAVRIGWLPRDPAGARQLRRHGGEPSYLSHADAGRFFALAVATDFAGFHVAYAASRPPEGRMPSFDLTTARDLIGYEPRDVFPAGLPFEVE